MDQGTAEQDPGVRQRRPLMLGSMAPWLVAGRCREMGPISGIRTPDVSGQEELRQHL